MKNPSTNANKYINEYIISFYIINDKIHKFNTYKEFIDNLDNNAKYDLSIYSYNNKIEIIAKMKEMKEPTNIGSNK